MLKTELINRLNELYIRPTAYSLEGDLLWDRIIMFNSYNDWHVFYLDERGNRNEEKIFHSESEACDYIFDFFKKKKDYLL